MGQQLCQISNQESIARVPNVSSLQIYILKLFLYSLTYIIQIENSLLIQGTKYIRIMTFFWKYNISYYFFS